MIGIKATLDERTLAGFNDALGQLRDALGNTAALAPRNAALMLCKSFRASTKPAKKNKKFEAVKSDTNPKWITYKNGKKLDRPLRRWDVHLVSRGVKLSRYVYAGSAASAKKQLRTMVGINYYQPGQGSPARRGGHRGLAKISWNWVMRNIYVGAAPLTMWARGKRDLRNPVKATDESMSKTTNGVTRSGGLARICNKLDYIGSATRLTQAEAVRKAAAAMVRYVAVRNLSKSGSTANDIKRAASKIVENFKREFSWT